jgi:hypothetical protein
MHTEGKTLSLKENQRSFISYRLRDGREGTITDVEVNEFWMRIALHPLNGIKKAKIRATGDEESNQR